MDKYLEIKNVLKTIKHQRILSDICMQVESGEIIGIKGINGSGKTMLLRAIAGFIRYDGEILFYGKQRETLENTNEIGVLIEHQNFLNQFTGKENLELLELLLPCKEEGEIDRVLYSVGLDPNDKRKYGKYSLGMKQRIAIAQAVMYRPKLILLDEPTNGLDEHGMELLEQLLKELKESGSTILVTSHDIDFLKRVSDRCFMMKRGELIDEAQD